MFDLKALKEVIDKLKPSSLDDIVDKAHCYFTTGLLLLMCVTIGAKQMFGEPMSCMAGAENPKAWLPYINSYCFVTNTFRLNSSDEMMPINEDFALLDELKVEINYYQWVPYALAVQAMLFFLPHFFWSLARKSLSDVNFKHLVDKCVKGRAMSVEDRKKEIEDVVRNLAKVSEHRQIKENALGLGSSGTVAYIAYKCLNILNVVAQIFLLYLFIGGPGWGVHMIGSAKETAYQNHTGFFPRVTFCTFKQNSLTTGLQRHTVQCVLTTNAINEKIFAMLYVWFAVLLVIGVLNAIYTFLRYVSPVGLRFSSKRYLNAHPQKSRVEWSKFADFQLDHDGLLLLRFIENNAGFLIASDVACKFYDYLRKPAIRGKAHNHDGAQAEGVTKQIVKDAHRDSADEDAPLYPPKI